MGYVVDLEHRFTHETKPVFNRSRCNSRYFKTAHAARIAGLHALRRAGLACKRDWQVRIRLGRDYWNK